jgi:putative phosphoribosyl transferase
MIFRNRREAGLRLADRLGAYAGRHDVVVLALPRGGVPVAHPIAQALQAPLDVFLVRKLGVPGQEELAMGAVASGGVRVLNEDVLHAARVSQADVDRITTTAMEELERQHRAYRGESAAPALEGRVVILVDDGLATGASMRAAILALKRLQPSRIVVAVPVGAADTCQELMRLADEVVCAATPAPFFAVGRWYADFAQTTDQEVQVLLSSASPPARRAPSP